MKLVYTEQALTSLEETLDFISNHVSAELLDELSDSILESCETLLHQPFQGQEEPYLLHLGLGHRRLVVGHFKILYRVDEHHIYITDIFDTRQNPMKMKG